jgi:hypothetical protein
MRRCPTDIRKSLQSVRRLFSRTKICNTETLTFRSFLSLPRADATAAMTHAQGDAKGTTAASASLGSRTLLSGQSKLESSSEGYVASPRPGRDGEVDPCGNGYRGLTDISVEAAAETLSSAGGSVDVVGTGSAEDTAYDELNGAARVGGSRRLQMAGLKGVDAEDVDRAEEIRAAMRRNLKRTQWLGDFEPMSMACTLFGRKISREAVPHYAEVAWQCGAGLGFAWECLQGNYFS